ncbi:DUF721 domain-containing protein [Rickettsia endosymbiont of Cardiosporidium cionae]|uniref:DUF721 domain-containing protein n=1 Tax=Rickettsia endosymbiont of Cardiosporidium cionae TaxID=2777155 RepID=UPI001893A0DE|nr:DUF721 domain-containing protein [Rickettsia endosymbiont of Cardiosporidium cionae]KAF8818102.1 hypothetical protein IHI24_000829 [Rickettsia endosymbiont of Cardiosporidium cionae]
MYIKLADVVQQFLDEVLKKSSSDKAMSSLVMNWDKIVGLELYKISYPVKIYSRYEKDNTSKILYISVSNPSLSMKIYYQQSIIIEKISIYLGYKAVDKIRIIQ